jgi:hypothetical protein
MEWLGELQQRFAGKGKILVCLEQSRGAVPLPGPGLITQVGPPPKFLLKFVINAG